MGGDNTWTTIGTVAGAVVGAALTWYIGGVGAAAGAGIMAPSAAAIAGGGSGAAAAGVGISSILTGAAAGAMLGQTGGQMVDLSQRDFFTPRNFVSYPSVRTTPQATPEGGGPQPASGPASDLLTLQQFPDLVGSQRDRTQQAASFASGRQAQPAEADIRGNARIETEEERDKRRRLELGKRRRGPGRNLLGAPDDVGAPLI